MLADIIKTSPTNALSEDDSVAKEMVILYVLESNRAELVGTRGRQATQQIIEGCASGLPEQ